MSLPSSRKPWPLKWIVLAIVLFIGPYTFLTLHFRKPGPEFFPYADAKNRVTVARLLSSGFQRVAVGLTRPAESAPAGAPAPVAAAAGGLPALLSSDLLDQPLLPVSIDRVEAAASGPASRAYAIRFTCTLPDQSEQPSGGLLYVRDGQIVVVPVLERLGGGLLARTRDSELLLTVPGGALRPGRYTVTLVGAATSRQWVLQVH